MAREFSKSFYKSKEWKKTRAAYIKYRQAIDGGMCERCGDRPGYIIHHKVELSPDNIDDQNITLGFGNMMFVCLDCHNTIHYRKDSEIPGEIKYRFDDDGNVVAT